MSGDHTRPEGEAAVADAERPAVHPRSPRQALMPDEMPPPPSRRVRHPFVVVGNAIFTLVVLLIIGGGAALYMGKRKFDATGPLDRERTVMIQRGQGIRDIAEQLRREGVIDQPLLFVIGAALMRVTDELKAGEYLFERNASMREVLALLVEGRSIQHAITIPEGLTSEQIVAKLGEQDVLTGAVREIPKEGTLLPETYKVTRGFGRDQVLQRMAAAHRRLVQEVWERRSPDLPLRSPEELVTLASIVEKETGRADERTRVAAVFINRLQRRMRLQSDPTVVYGIAGGKAVLGRGPTRDELDRPTPYNTYIVDGLPPGPIANPGRASLEATANPSRTKEIYFVADGTGGHVFAESYEQHVKNVARWREVERQQDPNAAAANRQLLSPQPSAPLPQAVPRPPNARATRPANGKAGANRKQDSDND
jgi:peptidoglycan lytic transglycosylase G